MKKTGKLIRVIAFLVGLVLIVLLIEPLFRVRDLRIRQTTGFYQEEKNALDAVYVGSSNVYAYWQPPLGFEKYGLAVYNYSLPQMPVDAFKYILEECRKTQPNALYILNLNAFKTERMTEATLHFTLDSMPFSPTKVKLVNELAAQLGYTGLDKLEFYFPMVRFHSGWSDLEKKDFTSFYNGMKSASVHTPYLKNIVDVSDDKIVTDTRSELTEKQLAEIQELMQYCKTENIKILFVAVPQAFTDESTAWELNTLYDMVVENGFDAINLLDGEAASIDFTTDFYNRSHCNVHGALKFTNYLGQYLVDNYGFEDHRGDPAYESWQQASELYQERITPYTMDFERQYPEYDLTMPVPDLSETVVSGQSITLNWTQTENADAYDIYRHVQEKKNKWSVWEHVATVDAQTLSYTDYELLPSTTYGYTVLPFRMEDHGNVYGKIDHTGINVTTTLDATKLLSLEENENGITITWENQAKAVEYVVYRAVKGAASWEQLAVVENLYYDAASVYPENESVCADTSGSGDTSSFADTANPEDESASADAANPENENASADMTNPEDENASADTTNPEDEGSDTDTEYQKIVCSYTDTDYDKDLPYVYTVLGRVKIDGEPVPGLFSKPGLMRYADLKAPAVTAQYTTDNQLQLNWEPVAGASHYYVYKQTGPEQWERVARTVASTGTGYIGPVESASYKVCAVIEHNEEIYEFPSEIVEIKGGEQ